MYGLTRLQDFSFTSIVTSSILLASTSLITMSTASRTVTKALILLFTSILIFGIFWFTSNSTHQLSALHFNSTLSKLVAFIEGKQIHHAKPQNSDRVVSVSNGFEEKDVVEVSAKNFNQFLMTKNRYLIVHFHAWWSPLSRRQRPVYATAATKLKGEVVLARVDVTRETKFAAEYKIVGYPSLFFFVNGVHIDTHYYKNSSDAIVDWVKGKMGCRIYNVMSRTEGERILTAKSMVVLAFFDSFEGKDAEELAAASELHTDVNFYQTASADIARMFKIHPQRKCPVLIVLKKESGLQLHNHFDGQFISGEIAEFVSLNKHPLSTSTAKNAPVFYTNSEKHLLLLPAAQMVDAEEGRASF
ncbi:hypothetical protein HS088_TW21G01671 [Tripterygium wilfordii]|uniref:protein disulfide-isomerase n=1 Tax=Tripterygium wilfordii TaxID=458696 RepID=A0A7J7C5T6_TRIWF|nr:protein disulfide isomerase-like 1-3 [Tripterygium wilfordii]KAF5729504.1 hypothetical protein HS088_TW21G01671 [Tripterygium wilfordii]